MGFTAPQLQPSLTAPFIMGFALKVLVERASVENCLALLLPCATHICRHTDIVHISAQAGGQVKDTRYVWTHPKMRPWGHELPVQCPQCFWVRPWISCHSETSAAFACKHCDHRLRFSAPKEKNKRLGGAVHGGRWLAVEHTA